MTEELSTFTQLAVMFCAASIVLSVACSVLVMGDGIISAYSDKFIQVSASANSSSIISLSTAKEVPAPVAYSTISSAISEVDVVYCNGVKIYQYNDMNIQQLITLMTTHKNHNVRVTVETGVVNSSLWTVRVEVVT